MNDRTTALSEPATRALDTLTDDELERSVEAWEAVVSHARANQARLLCEADRRQLHTRDGARSLAEWAAARLDLAPESARVLVRTARHLGVVSEVEAAMEDGTVTFDRAVELCRAAADGIGIEDHAAWDVAGLRRLIAHRRRMTPMSERQAFDERYLTLQPSLDHSRTRLHGLLPGSAGCIVEQALDRRADAVVPDGERPSLAARRADALVSLCTGEGESASGEPGFHVFVDRDGASIEGTIPVGPDTIEEVLCTGSVEVVDVSEPSNPQSVGRRTRVIPRKLRRTIIHRDLGACVIDGCSSRYRLEVHHVVPWSEGGRTDPENLVTLCWYHHHVVVHGEGRRIDPRSPARRRRFLRSPP